MGKTASGEIEIGQRAGLTFASAFEDYIRHLREKAKAAGKHSTWADSVQHFYKKNMSHFATRTLSDLSDSPGEVAAWHRDLAERRQVTADHCARIIRATYRYAQRLNRRLPAGNPTSAIRFGKLVRSEKTIADFATHAAQIEELREHDPIRASFHMLCLLFGGRPGEVGRLKWRVASNKCLQHLNGAATDLINSFKKLAPRSRRSTGRI